MERGKKITLGGAGSKPALNSVGKGNRLPHEKPESPPPSSRAGRRNSGLCPVVKTRTMESKAPSESSEVDELKQKLHDANLRMAEVVYLAMVCIFLLFYMVIVLKIRSALISRVSLASLV